MTRAKAIAFALRLGFTAEERKKIRIFFGLKKSERAAKGLYSVMHPLRFIIPTASKEMTRRFGYARGAAVGESFHLPLTLHPIAPAGEPPNV